MVRRRQRRRPHGAPPFTDIPDSYDIIRSTFYKDPAKYGTPTSEEPPWRWNRPEYVDIPWGSPLILLSYERMKNSKRYMMRILYDNLYLVGEVSDKQANNWFCFIKKWKSDYAHKLEKMNKNKK